MPTIASPCVGVCHIDADTHLCSGCMRSLEEIAGWGGMSDERRRVVMDEVEGRRVFAALDLAAAE